jgi:hypothetical protein
MTQSIPRSRTFVLAVTAVGGAFSARAVLCAPANDGADFADLVGPCTVDVVSAPAGFTLVCDVLKPGGDPNTNADWRLAVDTANVLGVLPEQDFDFGRGVGFRAESGGVAGNVTFDVTWEATS